jgi:mono/diheme cytochrome c family protein
MKKSVWVMLVVLVLGAVVLAACGGSSGGGTSNTTKTYANPPADFANAKNPFEGNADAVKAGSDVFTANCVSCHGADAKGDGPAAASLDPKPANLQVVAKGASEQFMHWVVTEGGAAAGLSSSMPSFKGGLSDDQIWQVVTYLKTTYGK